MIAADQSMIKGYKRRAATAGASRRLEPLEANRTSLRGSEAKGAEAPTPPRSRGRGRSCSGGGDPRARCADRTGRVPARRASGAGNAKSMDEVKMKRIQWSEEKKNLLMKKIFALLQKVSASRRRHLLESWTPRHRRALEAWCLTSQDARGRCRAPAPALAAPAAPAAAGAAGAGSGAAEWPDAGTAELRSSDRRQMRGIASFYRKGTVFYQVSLCIQSLCMTARKVRELDRAVDILLMLMSIKQKMGGIVDPSLFVQKMTDAVPAAFEEYGVTAEEMGLRFQVMMCMRFWVRPPLHTPQQAKLEDALQAWSRLTRFRSPLGQGARGFARMDLKELEERWRAFREVYLDILTEGGPSDQSRRFNASRRLDALAEVEWARCSTAAELFRVDLQCLLEDSGARWHAAAQSLGEAARKGDLNVMMAKLLDGGDPNERDHLHPKYTPLHRAASGGHRHAVRLLLKAKADVLMRDRLGFSALHFAANQSVGLVSDLVEAKCDVNAANLQQMTPLHSAAGMGRVDICEFLLAAGAGAGPHGLATPADLARRAAERRPARSVEQEACLRLAERLVQASEAKGSWFYESEPVDSGHLTSEWLPFTSTASDELEAALLRGEEELEIQTPAGYRVLVDLKSKLQRNTATGCTRRVRRDTPSPAPDPTLEPRAPWVPAAPGHWGGLVSTGAQKWRVTSTS
ncbi:unnamed protein product [Durusdinium trenchii]|uniref:WWE domain-containing protein n=2 Tax=Durusdinium trenchii TaxID=1381693 RepID=A0ABP0PAP3_9DINO